MGNIVIEKRYFTVKDAAEFLGVNIKTIYRAIAAGELPARRIGRVLRIPRSALVIDGEGDANHGGGRTSRGTVSRARPVASLEE
jgi:excisionase family DNA binding protein